MDGIVIDLDNNLCNSKIVTDDFPDAITLKMVQQAIRLNNAETTYLHPDNRRSSPGLTASFPGNDSLEWSNPKRRQKSYSNAKVTPGTGSLRQYVVDAAHE